MGNEVGPDRVASMVTFARVVEAGSFTAAARTLGLSKAAVSKQVARLEQGLGAQLLRRTTRRMSLTEVGEAFYARCMRIAEQAEEAERVVGDLETEPRGLLRVSAPHGFGARHVAPLVARFLARHAEMRVDLRFADQYVDLVEEGFDLAIRIGDLADSSLMARRFAPCRLVICGAPSYLGERGRPRSPRDLQKHRTLNYFGTRDTWNFTRGRKVRVTGSLGVNSGEGVREAALAGAGLCYLPTYHVGEDILAGRLEPVLIDEVPQRLFFHAVYPGTRHLSPKVRAFIDQLVEELGGEPPWDAFLAKPARRPRAAAARSRAGVR